MERRLMERYNVALRAFVSYRNARTQEYKTKNLSAGGAFFITDNTMPEGTRVFVSLFIDAMPDKQVREKTVVELPGTVRRRTRQGMAVAFDHHHRFAWR